MGAEQLLGKGDMLISHQAHLSSKNHGAFVSDAEVHKVVKYSKSRFDPYTDSILNPESSTQSEFDGSVIDNENDPLYDKAVNIVLTNKSINFTCSKTLENWIQ